MERDDQTLVLASVPSAEVAAAAPFRLDEFELACDQGKGMKQLLELFWQRGSKLVGNNFRNPRSVREIDVDGWYSVQWLNTGVVDVEEIRQPGWAPERKASVCHIVRTGNTFGDYELLTRVCQCLGLEQDMRDAGMAEGGEPEAVDPPHAEVVPEASIQPEGRMRRWLKRVLG